MFGFFWMECIICVTNSIENPQKNKNSELKFEQSAGKM